MVLASSKHAFSTHQVKGALSSQILPQNRNKDIAVDALTRKRHDQRMQSHQNVEERNPKKLAVLEEAEAPRRPPLF